IPVPNGDFENWDNTLFLQNWQTNSCPVCDPPYESYIIRKDSSSYHGTFAAKFIYNNVFPAQATNGFSISTHPANLTGYVKSKFPAADSASIKVYLFNNGVMVDSGKAFITSSIPNYTKIEIPITSNTVNSDSASIIIRSGTHLGSELWIDYLRLLKD
ncbi:MAG: hypothetical protein ABIQ02_07775, partial [Saprospiraceae bacterium]